MCSRMVFTTSGMLTKQTSVQHPWVWVWSGTVRVGSGLRVDVTRLGWNVTVMTLTNDFVFVFGYEVPHSQPSKYIIDLFRCLSTYT